MKFYLKKSSTRHTVNRYSSDRDAEANLSDIPEAVPAWKSTYISLLTNND